MSGDDGVVIDDLDGGGCFVAVLFIYNPGGRF